MNRYFLLPAAAALFLTSACASSPDNSYYRLSSEAVSTSASYSSTATQLYALGGVSLPPATDRPEIVVNTGSNTVDLLEYQQWDEPLDRMVQHVLNEDLSRNLGPRWIRFPTPEMAGQNLIIVKITQFDIGSDGNISLSAWWTTNRETPATTSHTYSRAIQVSPPAIKTSVAAMSHLLADLSASIATSAP